MDCYKGAKCMAYIVKNPNTEDGISARYFEKKIMRSADYLSSGRPVSEADIIGPIKMVANNRNVPDFIFFDSVCHGVSEAFRRLLVDVAPHDFSTFPIEIVDSGGVPISGRYYYLNVLAFRESLILDHTNTRVLTTSARTPSGERVNLTRIDYRKLKMHRDKILGAIIWHEAQYGAAGQYAGQYNVFVSNHLVEEARLRGLSGFESIYPVLEDGKHGGR